MHTHAHTHNMHYNVHLTDEKNTCLLSHSIHLTNKGNKCLSAFGVIIYLLQVVSAEVVMHLK